MYDQVSLVAPPGGHLMLMPYDMSLTNAIRQSLTNVAFIKSYQMTLKKLPNEFNQGVIGTSISSMHSRITILHSESMLGCYRWMASQNISNLSIIFNITGKRDERPLLNLLAKLNPACIYLSPNIPNHVTSDKTRSRPDQENRVNPLFLVRNHNHL